MEVSRLEELRKKLRLSKPFRGIDRVIGRRAGGHTQTLLGHFLPTRKSDLGKSIRVELTMPDGDRLIGFQFGPEAQVATEKFMGLLHIFHGLAGSSDSNYMSRAAASALELGFTVVMWNHRGCGHGKKLALEPYHSGRSDDLARCVRWGRSLRSEGLHGVLGFSLSGNAACLLAARVVPTIDSRPLSQKEFAKIGDMPDFAIGVNPPFDLHAASEKLSHGFSRVYGQSFMPKLLENLDDRKDWVPENENRRALKNLAQRARKKLSLLTDVGTFDATYTGPAGGFRDHLDYYSRSSSGRYFNQATIPLIILSSGDDPITHGFAALSKTQSPAVANPLVVIDDQAEGGHVGYVDLATLMSPLKKNKRWLDRRIQLYLRAFLSMACAVLSLSLGGCSLVNAWKSGTGPSENTYQEGHLVDCSVDPNCVSTQSARPDHAIVPFTYSKPVGEAQAALKLEMSRVEDAVLIKEDGRYLHFECRSRVLRLADDLEFLFNEESKTLQFRSATRFGYSDWGVNRKRMEELRNKILGRI